MNKTSDIWVGRLKAKYAHNPSQPVTVIAADLKSQYNKETKAGIVHETTPPTYKTIRSILAKIKAEEAKDPDYLRSYRVFSWPTSMDLGIVPWEAAASCFDLLKELSQEARDNLPAALVERYWRVTQAAPGWDSPPERLELAIRLLIFEKRDMPAGIRQCQDYLIARRWEDPLPTLSEDELSEAKGMGLARLEIQLRYRELFQDQIRMLQGDATKYAFPRLKGLGILSLANRQALKDDNDEEES